MVTIKLLEINENATAILTNVETEVGKKIIKVLAWNKDTYGDYSAAIDLTHLLSGLNEKEEFTISNLELGVSSIAGLYVIEFTSDEEFNKIETGIVANLIPYHECILDKSLNITVKNCKIQKSKCGDVDTLLFASTLLDTLKDTIIFGLLEEAIQILDTLEDICEVCTSCPDYEGVLYQDGFGYKTVDNTTILT